ncbi:peroxide stress protein YaaA [Exilibacterium tricleocarpae]|uniref:UPF0246 protein FKG94_07670 n=1 Tax=Exilibacterium tricleocarpae TaxID=2591008 RepID=A0A545TZG4_9GAMM|nr:peroxide stress protein YaaA [Exilibacterium tricleocarpae]TQV82601.1 peroxide stress protein YaaA [Exilibacterium tricleocarpae]
MLTVISPAKTLDYETPTKIDLHTIPDFLDQSGLLIEELRQLAPQDLSELMGISDKLGALNYDRYQAWRPRFTPANAKPAALAFKGDVYAGLEAETFKVNDFKFAQKHLRILSGLYGLLRPLDLMQPYRLEMGTQLANSRGGNLYAFWGDIIADALNRQLKSVKGNTLINLASNEYFKAVNTQHLDAEVVAPVFKDKKGDTYKVISFFAKKARGMMSAYIVKNRITDPKQLKKFKQGGYRYNAGLSSKTQWVFTRDSSD